LLAALGELADDGDPRRAQKLAELGEVVALVECPHAQCALGRALRRL
jgi:hypothetical protein